VCKTVDVDEWFVNASMAEYEGAQAVLKQGVALTRRNTTGPPCSRRAIITLEVA